MSENLKYIFLLLLNVILSLLVMLTKTCSSVTGILKAFDIK